MSPEELAALFKLRGDFDSTRKNLLNDFQNSSVGKQFSMQLGDILQNCIEEDPGLLQREKTEFHQLMVERITKSSEYKKVQQFVDSLLQPAQYMSKIESSLMTIVNEQAPPPSEKEPSTEQDKDKEKVKEKEKEKDKDKDRDKNKDNSKSSKKNHTTGSVKEESGSGSGSKTTSNSKRNSSSTSHASSLPYLSKSASSQKREDSILSGRSMEKRPKDRPVKRELDLSLPPRPQPKKREPHFTTASVPSNGNSSNVLAAAITSVKNEPNTSGSRPHELTHHMADTEDISTKDPVLKEPVDPKDSKLTSLSPVGPDLDAASAKEPEIRDLSLSDSSVQPSQPSSQESKGHSETNGSTTTSISNNDSSTRKVVPKKRNRRRSMDSNSSLSSPPSSSEPETDGEGKSGEGGRAKKLAKKAALFKGEPTLSHQDSADTATGAVAADQADAEAVKDVVEDEMETVRMDVDYLPITAASPDNKRNESPAVPDADDSSKDSVDSGAKDSAEMGAETSIKATISGRGDKHDVTTSEAPVKSPVSTSAAARSYPSSSSSTSSSQQNSPATITSSSNGHRGRDSDAMDHKSPHNHHHSSHTSKRIGHQPLPLPPRPNIVPLPPKPVSLSLNRRASSHSRNSSSAAGAGAGALGTGLPPPLNSSSSGTGVVSPTTGSLSSSLPTLPALSSSSSSTPTSTATPAALSSPTTATPAPTVSTIAAAPSSSILSKQEKSPVVVSPTALPSSSSAATVAASSSSPPTNSSASKPKQHGRTPIPLPHKPIPLPPRPSLVASGSSSSPLKKKHK
ncbi:hypothetical protein BGZ99_001465 [Dissophora globulifera]|uniref:BOD1/SHG1 domain-containing protein n=1 Tax=Dissophora globulifera TaxID=979702 RepID=A0A9P6RRF0_9FUNG|nr:hypothetical protein BGZ99_001465 [Dissophora globulifera]